jgi:Mg-chelatase subunit ChlD
MTRLWAGFFPLFVFAFFFSASAAGAAAEPKVQILSPQAGSHITQQQNSVLVSGKVASQTARSDNVDIMFIVDISGSTANYAGVDFGDSGQLPDSSFPGGFGRPQISIGGFGSGGFGFPSMRNLRNSILAAEVGAARRLLTELSSTTTRVGVLTFSESARVARPLTHDYESVRRVLDSILAGGPYGGTNMADGIRTGIAELMGFGTSDKRPDAVKVEILLTDGFPTMPIGQGRRLAEEDTDLAISAARVGGKAGIKVHVFALGSEALSYTRAVVGIAKESAGTYTLVSRAADVLAVIENISAVGVEYVQVVNQTTGQKSGQTRLGADGSFSSAVPVVEGANQIEVSARASDGSTGRALTTIYYQSGNQKSLDLEVFLEKEKDLKLQVERLGKSPDQIQREAEQSREQSLRRPQQAPPVTEGPPR